MYLIKKQDARAPVNSWRLYDLSNIVFTRRNGGELIELSVDGISVDPRQSCLASARRAPQHKREHVALLDREPQRLAFAHKMRLAHELTKARGPDLIRQRLHNPKCW